MELWYDTKDYSFGEIKDVDLKGRRVSGYLSSFDNIDKDGDVMVKGAFKKSLQERKDQIHFLHHHNWEKSHGFFSELYEDDYGLGFVSNPLIDTSFSMDALKQYEAGIITKHSVGFNTLKKENKDGVRYLTEVKLWEGSCVTIPANDLAVFTGLKSSNPVDARKEIEGKLTRLTKAFRTGTFTDETFSLIDIAIKQFMTLSAQLAVEEYKESLRAAESTHEPMIDETKAILNYLKNK